MTRQQDIPALLDELCAIYDSSVANLREAVAAFVSDGTVPDPKKRAAGSFASPELRIDYEPGGPRPKLSRAFARLNQPGTYVASIARPHLFRHYLADQLEILARD